MLTSRPSQEREKREVFISAILDCSNGEKKERVDYDQISIQTLPMVTIHGRTGWDKQVCVTCNSLSAITKDVLRAIE